LRTFAFTVIAAVSLAVLLLLTVGVVCVFAVTVQVSTVLNVVGTVTAFEVTAQ
jgi:hypothetical protein